MASQFTTTAQPPIFAASTSIAAFVGRTPIGPVNVATPLTDASDYIRQFGGLSSDSAISYQANAFFANGGPQGLVVRLYRAPTMTSVLVQGTPASHFTYTIDVELSGTPVSVGFTATSTSAADVATGLAGAINRHDTLATVVMASAESSRVAIQLRATPALQAGAPAVVRLVSSSVVDGTGSPVASATTSLQFTSPTTIGAGLGGQAGSYVGLDGAAAVVMGTSGSLTFAAANGGSWGNALSVTLTPVPSSESSLYAEYGLNGSDTQLLFDLALRYFDGSRTQTETFLHVTFAGDAKQSNRIDKVLAERSRYLRYTNVPPNQTHDGPRLSAVVMVGCGAGGVDSAPLQVEDYVGDATALTGLHALNQERCGFNILCVPSDAVDDPSIDQSVAVYQAAAQICVDNDAMLIIDPPSRWLSAIEAGNFDAISIADLGSYTTEQARSSAVYFPGVVISDPLDEGRPKRLPPCGFMAAAWATTDAAHGVWKAPAGLDVPIGGITGLQCDLDDAQNGVLNPQGINVLRSFTTAGNVPWGARTLRGADLLDDPYEYIPVRRLALYITTSLVENTKWAVFQPNGPALWAQLQAQVSTFMAGLYSQGAFAGAAQRDAFTVECDATTTTPADQAAGIVNVRVAFAPIYPAEFVVITISQQRSF